MRGKRSWVASTLAVTTLLFFALLGGIALLQKQLPRRREAAALSALESGDTELARSRAGKVEDEELRLQILSGCDYRDALRYMEEGKLQEAAESFEAAGEYEEKLRACGLTLIAKRPEEPLRILADGRRMQRIFDNLMNNICKYALPGTRVYLSLEKMAESAVITFKNTSRAPLDISEEELLERFVRGDSARSSDGNGLGLSIARSLAELQGGKLRLHIDGDLFKAILVFPVCA